MRVSPQVLAILAASGLMGLSAASAQANPGFESSTLTPEAASEQVLEAIPKAANVESAAALLALPSTPAQAGLSPEAARDAAIEFNLPPDPISEFASSVQVDLQAAIDQHRPPVVEEVNTLPQASPEANLSADLGSLAIEAQSTTLSQTSSGTGGTREISPEAAQEIIDRAVERRSQTPGPVPDESAPPEPVPTEPVPTETDPTPAPGATDPTPTPAPTAEEAEPRVLVAELVVTAPEGDLDPTLVDLVFSVVQTRAGRTTTRTQLQQDINSIFATGYFADVDAVPTDTDLGVRVTFVAQPNPVLTDVRVVGNEVLPQSVADDIFAEQKGEIINLLDFQDGILELNQWYQDNGYVLAQVVAAPRVSDEGVVTLEVAEGVVESIEVRFFNEQGESVDAEGNPLQGRTHDYIITREFQTQPGDVFNQAQIERDFQRVFGLQIFEDIVPGLEPGAEDPRQVRLIVNVTERSTGSIAAGLGFNFTGDIFGTVSYRQDNFGGNNQKLSAEAQLSTRDILFDVSFTDPWIAGDPFRTSYTANAFARSAINLNFDGGPITINLPDPNNPGDLSTGDRVRIRRLGTGITFSRPLANGWTVAVGTIIQNVSARDADGRVNAVDAAGNPLTLSGTGVDDLWTVPLSATLDRRNDPFNPTSGSILRVNTEQSIPLGRGSIFMNRLRGSYSHYFPMSLINLSEGPQALAVNVQLGTILGDVPPYEAFALGGTNSIRGYDEGEVGGGRSYAQFTAEYRFPLFSFLGGALFVDAGTDLGSGNAVPGAPGPSRGKPSSGFGYGAGVRVQTPLGPLRIDYGFNDQGQGRIHFGIGERF
jgi:outer membrane protein insertion porin family